VDNFCRDTSHLAYFVVVFLSEFQFFSTKFCQSFRSRDNRKVCKNESFLARVSILSPLGMEQLELTELSSRNKLVFFVVIQMS
jgi:hypothetical protein